jgi:hypothetical protein
MDYNIKLKDLITEARPNLRESSVKTYISNLNKLAKEVGISKINNLIFLQHGGNIMKALDKKKLNTKKTYLATIIVILKAIKGKKNLIDFYTEHMNKLAEEHQKISQSQEKSESQLANWIELPELIKEIKRQGREINRLRLWTKEKLTPKEFDQIQKYVAGFLYIGDPENPPMRADFHDMKIICGKGYSKLDEKELKNNYIVKVNSKDKFFSLGDYKTEKKYGLKKIPVGKELNKVLNKWFKIVDKHNYILVNNRKKPMTANGLSKFMNRVFEKTGKKIGINMLRHIFISHHFPPQLAEKQEIASKMGHSTNEQSLYSKK